MIKKLELIFLSLLFTGLFSVRAQDGDFNKFPEGCSPLEIGRKVSARYLELPFRNFGGFDAPPAIQITYPEVCAWFGALKFAKVSKDKKLLSQLEERFLPLLNEKKNLLPEPDHVDHTVFGTIPLELYMQTKKKNYYTFGMRYPDEQWEMPVTTKHREKYRELLDEGLSWQTRYWIDDMYMISTVQSQAYLASKDKKYIERAAYEMTLYLDSIQRPNGLFYHAGDVPFFWGRGNGWMAAGMTELLKNLPRNNPHRERILTEYCKMMNTLKGYQKPDGMWGQLVDDTTSWSETSCTGMFAYAMITGVKKGWLNKEEYAPVAKKAWLALITYINENGDVTDVCEGTNKENSRQYYLDRKKVTGDMHGQAPVLWCAVAFSE